MTGSSGRSRGAPAPEKAGDGDTGGLPDPLRRYDPAVTPRPPRTLRTRAALAWVRSHLGLVVLLVVPFLVFGIPRLFGLTFLNGDNFLQNFPMRVLVGQDLRHGSLPLWNPYLFSGTPLLGGFNAGAGYPMTWLMAVMNVFTAWALTLAVAYDIALVGMYLFLRRQPLSSTAATLGAATFAFAGYLTGQLVHIDLIEGAIWLPWMLLAVHGLTERVDPARAPHAPAARPLRLWTGLLALSIGLSILSGGVEAIIDSLVLVAVYLVSRLLSMGWLGRAQRRRLLIALTGLVIGAAGGVAIGAAQWLPGLTFLSQSQRATPTFGFFTSGSLQERLFTLVASPFALGTNRNWPTAYVGTYNFPEVTSYVGILALIAAFSLLLRRWRTRPEARHWWVWYLILALGVVSALGNQTPLGHVLFVIPILKSQRLLNRNLLMVDTSLAVLLGWWSHLLLAGKGAPDPDAPTLRRRWQQGRRAEILVPSIPFVVIAALCLFLWVDGPLLYRWLEATGTVTTKARYELAGLLTVGATIAGAATWIVLSERRYSARFLGRALAAVLAVDLLVFNAFVIAPPINEAQALAQGSASAALESLTGNGRFIIYDPDEFKMAQLYALGQTDLNIFKQLPSAQGYTALTGQSYYRATGSHYQETLNPATLAEGVWDRLNVTILLSLPTYFVVPLPGSPSRPTAGAGAVIHFPAGNDAPPTAAPVTVAAGTSHRWYFGGVLTVDHLTVPVGDGGSAGLGLGLITPSGSVRWLPASEVTTTAAGSDRSLQVAFRRPTRAGGLVLRAGPTAPSAVGVPSARTAETGDVRLDGPLQGLVAPPHWNFIGGIGSFGAFSNSAAGGWARLAAPGGGAAPAGSSVRADTTQADGGQQLIVRASSAVVLERSESWSPGWRATVQSAAFSAGGVHLGPAEAVPVLQDGVIQKVDLPAAGTYLVTFTYADRSARLGVALSAAAGGAFAVWIVVEIVAAARRRRTDDRRSIPASGVDSG